MGIRRSLAYLADLATVTIVYILLFTFIGTLFFMEQLYLNPLFIVLFYVLYLVSFTLYFCVLPYYWNGYTLFKRALGLKVEFKHHRIAELLLTILKYVVFRLILIILSFGVLLIADLIYMRVTGASFVDRLLKTNIILY